MNKTNINTSWLGRGAWGIVVLLVGLLLGSCEPAGPTGETPGDGNGPTGETPGDGNGPAGETPGDGNGPAGETPGDENGPEEPVLKTLPADCLEVDLDTKTITGFYETKENCKLKEFAIPGEVPAADPITITVIGVEAFRGKSLTRLTIPNSVTTIGYGAFASNQLTSLTIPNSVTTIGVEAFRDNKLTNLTIGNKVKTIKSGAFASNHLESLTIPDSVETIEGHAFQANQLTELTIPDSVERIGWEAFDANPNLKTIILDPNSTLSFYANAFLGNLWGTYSTGANKGKAGTWTYAVTADPNVWSWTFKAATP